jgi:CHRD domain
MKTIATLTFLAASAAFAPAAIIQFDLMGNGGPGLLFTNEPGVTSGGTGGEVGSGITFDNVTKVLTINVEWGSANGFTDLTGSSTNAHVHGPTTSPGGNGFTETAGVLINIQTNPGEFTTVTSASDGSITGSTTLSLANETALFEHRLYINVHTNANPGGEIRGFMVIPEPASALFGLTALGVLGLRRRRA